MIKYLHAIFSVALPLICTSARAQTVPGANAAHQNHLLGVPIPSGRNAPTAKDSQNISKAWCKRIMLDEYNKTPSPDPKVAEFIRDAIDEIHGTAPAPAKLKADATALADAGVDDPLFLSLASGILGESRRDLYLKAMAGMEKSRYNKIVFYMASLRMNAELDAKKAPQADQDAQYKITLDLLRTALQSDAFKKEETDALLYRLDSNNAKLLFAKHEAEVCDILRTSTQVPAWVAEYYEGKRQLDEAWKARGTGWATTVSEEGWKGFADHLAQARLHLVKSWKLNPASPRAAAQMIKVAMGESEQNDTMRSWFDRAVAAQIDWIPAYGNMRWGLRPRWLGSIKEMVSFGEECMRTGRYDTGVPYEYVLAVKDASSELTDKGAILADAKINQNLMNVLNGYFSTPNSMNLQYLHAMAAIVAYKGGKLDVAQPHLQAVDYNLAQWSGELGKFVDIPTMITEVQLYQPK